MNHQKLVFSLVSSITTHKDSVPEFRLVSWITRVNLKGFQTNENKILKSSGVVPALVLFLTSHNVLEKSGRIVKQEKWEPNLKA